MRRPVCALVVLAACGGSAPPVPAPPAVAPAPPPIVAPVAPVAPHKDYPASRRDAVVDTLHGVPVSDPYRWLEDASQPEVTTWMAAQDRYARAHLAELPGRAAVTARLRELMYHDEIGPPIQRNGRLFYFRTHHDQEKDIAYWRQGEAGAEHVLFDPNTWSADGSTGLHGWEISWDGKHAAYAVSEHNADETVTHVLEVATGKVLPDTIPGTKFSAISWSADNRGFYYTYLPPASASLPASERLTQAELRYHRLGSDPARDAVVHAATGHRDWFLNGQASQDGHWLLLRIGQGSSGAESWFFQDLRKARPAWQTLIDGVDASFSVVPWRDTFYVHTNDGAPRWHVFAVDPRKPARAAWKEIIPEQAVTIQNVDVIGGHLILNLLRNAASELEVHALDGALVRKIPLPPLGTASGLFGLPGEDTAYFSYRSFTEVGAIYKTSIKAGTVTEWARTTLPFDASEIIAEQVRYKSKDGTEIPMFLVHRKDVRPTGAVPTMLSGYGGFQVSLTPVFGARYAVFLEHGGLVAFPSLRGGGEFGEAWHRAGMMANKQNVFDDFIAAAHYLIDQHWTSPAKLAIRGASNGGLLVGAAMVQAPELFKAVVCGVPLLDMVRYHKLGLGAAWMSEYGSAEDATQFQALYAYSPYHHVRDGVHYPALLLLSSDHDDRVDPMHARKFTAAMQAASDAPVWLRIEQNAGHGGADMIAAEVAENADLLTFVMAQLGM